MRRVLVIGCGGSGKTTFANRLGAILGLQVVHLDALYWRPGWVEPPKPEWAAIVEQALARDAWIMDGNYSGTLERRLAACDTVVFLDIGPVTCAWRAIRRALVFHRQVRPDMAPGCPERLDLAYLLWILGYPTRSRPSVLRLLAENAGARRVVRLRSGREADRFLGALESAAGQP